MHLLTAEQQDRLRRLARRSPAFIGMKIVVHDNHVEVLEPEELHLGFDALSAKLLRTPEADWPDAVDEHFRRGIEAITADSSELDGPTEDILGRVYQRLMPSDMEYYPDYAFPIAPGLVWTLAFDHPDYIQVLNDEHVARHGVDRLSEAGIGNLCREVPDRVGVRDGGIYALEGNDYVGSLLLVTPWLTELVCDEPEPPYGALVSAPNRNMTIFHLIRNGVETRYAIDEIAKAAAECHDDNSHPLDRSVHWWRPGRIEPVAVFDGREVRTSAPAEFDDLLRELG